MDLQAVWFWILGFFFIGYAVLDGFDLGTGIIHLFTRDPKQRLIHFRAVKPIWDGNEVWLIAGGAALFASFPPVYATVFSGFYLALFLVLVALVFRAVSIEFIEKHDLPRWRRSWDWGFGLGSLVASLLFGVAVGNILRGIPISDDGYFAGTFLSLLNPYSLLTGVLVVVLFTMHGAAWLAPKTEGEIQRRMRAWTIGAWVTFVPLYLVATAATYLVSPDLILRAMRQPMSWVMLILLAGGAVSLPLWIKLGRDVATFAASTAIIIGSSTLGGLSLFPTLVPSRMETANSLTVYNASSSELTLTLMFWIVAITMPFILAYTAAVHWIFRGKVDVKDESVPY